MAKLRPARRVLGIVILSAIGIQSCTMAVYSGWQTAFIRNAPHISELSLRFWFYSLVTLVAFVSAVMMAVMTVRRINKDFREEQKEQKGPISD